MALMAAKDDSGIPRSLILDPITRALVTVDQEHFELHEGDMYHVGVSQIGVTDTNDITALVFSTPPAGGKRIHMLVQGNAEDAVEFRLIETPSVDEAENTSILTPYNKDRDSEKTSQIYDNESVKATAGSIGWTGVAQELDSFSIGLDVYLVSALEATADALGLIWIDLGDAQAATMDGVAITAIDAAQGTSLNDQTVEASQGAGTTVDLDADGFGENGNLEVVIIVGANMTAGTSLSGGVGAPNTGKDAEIHGAIGKVTYLDKADAVNANISTTVSLFLEKFGSSTTPINTQAGQSRGTREWILAAGTQYCLYMKSLNANDNVHVLNMDWYEHTHKDPTSIF